jgi:DNA-binding NtrC family response regulator
LPPGSGSQGKGAQTISNEAQTNRTFLDLRFKKAVAALERELIRRALEASGGNRAEAARRLGINRRLLNSKLEEQGDQLVEVPMSNKLQFVGHQVKMDHETNGWRNVEKF